MRSQGLFYQLTFLRHPDRGEAVDEAEGKFPRQAGERDRLPVAPFGRTRADVAQTLPEDAGDRQFGLAERRQRLQRLDRRLTQAVDGLHLHHEVVGHELARLGDETLQASALFGGQTHDQGSCLSFRRTGEVCRRRPSWTNCACRACTSVADRRTAGQESSKSTSGARGGVGSGVGT